MNLTYAALSAAHLADRSAPLTGSRRHLADRAAQLADRIPQAADRVAHLTDSIAQPSNRIPQLTNRTARSPDRSFRFPKNCTRAIIFLARLPVPATSAPSAGSFPFFQARSHAEVQAHASP